MSIKEAQNSMSKITSLTTAGVASGTGTGAIGIHAWINEYATTLTVGIAAIGLIATITFNFLSWLEQRKQTKIAEEASKKDKEKEKEKEA